MKITMAILPILQYPDPTLRVQCQPVERFDEALATLISNMIETMYAAPGVGLAAPQVGSTLAVAVIDVSDSRGELLELVNPSIVASSGSIESEEGCLSICRSDGDTYRDFVPRFKTVKVRAFDRTGKEYNFDAEGLLSICVQHELDHLKGVLFIDYLSRLKRERFKKWLDRQSQE